MQPKETQNCLNCLVKKFAVANGPIARLINNMLRQFKGRILGQSHSEQIIPLIEQKIRSVYMEYATKSEQWWNRYLKAYAILEIRSYVRSHFEGTSDLLLSLTLSDLSINEDPDWRIRQSEFIEEVRQKIAGFPEKQRKTLFMNLDGYIAEDIARTLGLSVPHTRELIRTAYEEILLLAI